jgi:hypothetical protein
LASRSFSRRCASCLAFVVVLLTACEKKNEGPTAPAPDSNTAFNGTWIGLLSGPDSTQRSGWSPESRDSIRVVFSGATMKFYMAPAHTFERSLSPPADTCFTRYPAALNSSTDLNVSFRVNFRNLSLGSGERFDAVRNGNTVTGTMRIAGDAVGGTWTATSCPTCPDSANVCP